MKKLISMLLAVFMSLSAICSSFTVAAVDGMTRQRRQKAPLKAAARVFVPLVPMSIPIT